jgi:SAM-dependent methyltransferase
VSAILASGTWAGIGQAELLGLMRDPVDATARDVLGRLGVAAGWRCQVLGADTAPISRWLAARTDFPAATAGNGIAPGGAGHPTLAAGADFPPATAANGIAHGGAADLTPAAPTSSSDRPYDLVLVRLAVSHWAEPAAGLAEVAAGLRPGGWLVAADLDWAAAHPVPGPHADGLAAGLAAARELLGLAGEYDPTAGAALPGLLARAGLTAVAHDYRSRVITGGTAPAHALAAAVRAMSGPLLGLGIASPATVAAVEAWAADPAAAAVLPAAVLAWARRPTENGAAR